MTMTSNTGYRGCRLRQPLLKAFFPLAAICLILASGCSEPAKAKPAADIAGLKLQDFSELKVPGERGRSAIFIVCCYEVDLENLALVRILAGEMQNVLPAGSRGKEITADGLYAAYIDRRGLGKVFECLEQSKAKPQRQIAMMFYDLSSEDYWFTDAPNHGRVSYKGISGDTAQLDMSDGYLGFSFAVSFNRRLQNGLPFTVSPVYQNKNTIPGAFLSKLGQDIDTGRQILSKLSFTAVMDIGDALIICPDMVPLDDSTFSKYAFSGASDTKFKIYCVFCKSITGV